MIYTTANLIDSIVTRAQLPDTTNTKTISAPANLLNLATEEMRIKLVPFVMDSHKDFYVRTLDIPLVAYQTDYPLPTRAIGNVIRSLRMVNGTTDMPLIPVERDEVPTMTAAQPFGYFFENNNIVLYPAPSSTGPVLRLRYFIRPNRLEQVINCAQISAINTGLNQVTVSTIPTAWGTGTVVDLISQINPYSCSAIDQAISTVSGTTITFAALPSSLAVNDFIALAEYSPLPQMPEEYQPVLSQMVVCKCLEATGDRQGLAAALADLKINVKNAVSLITPRDMARPEKIVGNNWRRLRLSRTFLR